MNSRLQLQNPPTRIHFQSPKGDFAAVARGFNRRAMGTHLSLIFSLHK